MIAKESEKEELEDSMLSENQVKFARIPRRDFFLRFFYKHLATIFFYGLGIVVLVVFFKDPPQTAKDVEVGLFVFELFLFLAAGFATE